MVDAVAGTYFDLKFIKTRKVAQMIVEVPIERAGEVVALFGTPMPDQEVWVAVAPLKTALPATARLKALHEQIFEKPKRKWDELKPSEQAGIACADEGFQKWVGSLGWEVSEAGAAACVRRECDVESRREFDRDPIAETKWHTLYARYQRETGRVAEERR